MSSQTFLGSIAVAISFLSYVPYFRDVLANRTKPHAFSWLVWSILTLTAFFGQLAAGAAAGSWVLGFTSFSCLAIFFLALQKGERNIVTLDWLSLLGAGISLLFWFLLRDPLGAVVLITLVDAFGFFPTFRKSFFKPREETPSTYFLAGLKFVFSLAATKERNLTTLLYPSYLIAANWSFVALILIRRFQLMKAGQPDRPTTV